MSSDVYLYFYEDVERTNLIDQIRIGDMGVLHYFGFDAIHGLDKILNHNPILTKDMVYRISLLFRHAHSSIAIDSSLTQEGFARAYGYIGPYGIAWDDITTEEDIKDGLQPLIGKYISLGWD